MCKDYSIADIYEGNYSLGTLKEDYSNNGIQIDTGELDSNGEPIKTLVAVDKDVYKNIYISNLKPVLVTSTPSGLRIDLNTGHIDGYDLYLSGTGKNGSFILNSSDETTPFKIGDNLSATWKGELFC